MIIRFIKILLGIMFVINAIREYGNLLQHTGRHEIASLIVISLLGVFGLVLAYSGIKNRPFFSYFSRSGRKRERVN